MTLSAALERVREARKAGLLTWYDDQGDPQFSAADNLELWLTNPVFVQDVEPALPMLQAEQWPLLIDCFKQVIPFGTAGRRGVCQPGPNRMNARTVAESAAGLADYYLSRLKPGEQCVCVVARDCRLDSPEFARICAEVLIARGVQVLMFPGNCVTPMLAYTVLNKGATCGVMITASHNPPEYNGFKAYGPHGGQVVPPDDQGIIDCVNALRTEPIPRTPLSEAGDLLVTLGDHDIRDYVNSVASQAGPGPKEVKLAYSPLQGCGAAAVLPVLESAGFGDVAVVKSELLPNGHFDVVPKGIANPESEPAMNGVKLLLLDSGAAAALASDPDADRIGLIARQPDGESLRFFNGNEIGVLVTWWAIHHRLPHLGVKPEDCWVIKSIVTTELVAKLAAAAKVNVLGDLPVGFRWIGQFIESTIHNPQHMLAAIEESHGVNCGARVRDKDAPSGCLALAELMAWLQAEGLTATELLDRIHAEHGYHREWMVPFEPPTKDEIAKALAGFRSNPPAELAGRPVASLEDRQLGEYLNPVDGTPIPENFLVFRIGDEQDGAKVAVRPSGTEPKMKIYVQAWRPAGNDLAATREELDGWVQAIGEDLSGKATAYGQG